MARIRRSSRSGTTLIELIVVLVVLATIASFVAGSLSHVAASAPLDTTRASLDRTRAAILGQPGATGGYLSDLGSLPDTLAGLFSNVGGEPSFDPATGLGWRGPYLATSTGSYSVDPARGFTTDYGNDGDPAVLDGFGQPIVLQVPDPDGDGVRSELDRRHARLVSAGPDAQVQAPLTDANALAPGNAWFPSLVQCADDVVLYLRSADLRP